MTVLAPPLFTFVVVVGLYVFSVVRPPRWVGEVNVNSPDRWKLFNYLSAFVAVAMAVAAGFAYETEVVVQKTAVMTSAALLGYLTVQNGLSDLTVRKADGRLQYIATILALVAHTVALAKVEGASDLLWVTYAVVAVMFALRFFVSPRKVGPADFRAVMVSAAAFIPVCGIFSFLQALQFSGILIVLYGLVVVAMKQRSPMRTLKALATDKVHLPIVPMLMLPATIMLPLLGLMVNK